MIYFYFGSDRQAIQKKTKATFEALRKKKPDASFVVLNGENMSLSDLEAISSSQGLFEKKIVAKLSDILSNKDLSDDVLKLLPQMKASENIIVWGEAELNKPVLEKIKKNAEKIEEFNLKNKEVKKEFNIFALSDALGARDRKKLWYLIVEALRNGSAPEEIHGTLWWQLKCIKLADIASTAEEAGLKPFVFGKAKGFARNWPKDALDQTLNRFVDMYHDAHRGECDFEVSLERFALSI